MSAMTSAPVCPAARRSSRAATLRTQAAARTWRARGDQRAGRGLARTLDGPLPAVGAIVRPAPAARRQSHFRRERMPLRLSAWAAPRGASERTSPRARARRGGIAPRTAEPRRAKGHARAGGAARGREDIDAAVRAFAATQQPAPP
eukprot:2051954-Pyramimonas_sp.AAC.1